MSDALSTAIDGAIKNLEEAKKAYAENPTAISVRECLLIAEEKVGAAMTAFRDVCARDMTDVEVHITGGDAEITFKYKGDEFSARAIAITGLHQNPGQPPSVLFSVEDKQALGDAYPVVLALIVDAVDDDLSRKPGSVRL
jgi:hypothetical protein